MPEKVTIKNRMNDLHVIGLLTKQGINKEYVELLHDYSPRSRGKEHTPYARFYRDRVSGLHIMIASILPKVTHAGFFIIPKFRQVGSKFISEENCFEAEISNGTVKVVCINDQPNGRKLGDWAEWHPQVYLDSVEQHCGNPIWLDTDPINSGYQFNTIEWSYGFCKRRVRNIEGRFRDRITILSDPHYEVRVANNVTGNMRLRFGSRDGEGNPIGKVVEDVEIISKEELAKATYPIVIGASPETFYPDPNPETATVDGWAGHGGGAGWNWATIRAGASANASDDLATTLTICRLRSQATAGNWAYMDAGIYLFNTEPLPNFCTITYVVFSLRGTGKINEGGFIMGANVYSSNPATKTALIPADFTTRGDTAYSTSIVYPDWNIDGYNDFILIDVDTDGFGYISKTGLTQLSTRGDHDADNDEPAHVAAKENDLYAYSADQGNTGSDPKLVVTYTILENKSANMGAKMIAGKLI